MRIYEALVCLLVLASIASASIPIELSDQGTDAVNSSGSLVDGNQTTLIFNSSSGGTPQYNETFIDGLLQGRWNNILGHNASNPLILDYMGRYYKDYLINGKDQNFTLANGTVLDRLPFYSPLGMINYTYISNAPWLTSAQVEALANLTNYYTKTEVDINISALWGAIFNDRINLTNHNSTISALIVNDSANRGAIANDRINISNFNTTFANHNATIASLIVNGSNANATIGALIVNDSANRGAIANDRINITNLNVTKLENGSSAILTTLNTTGNITGQNITAQEYLMGQPLTGMLGSGLIYTQTGTGSPYQDVNVTCVGLTCSYDNFTMRITLGTAAAPGRYCKLPAGSLTVPDNTFATYYVDSNCAIQQTTYDTWFSTLMNQGGKWDFAHILTQNGVAEVTDSISLEQRRLMKARVLNYYTQQAKVISGFNFQNNSVFPSFNITSGLTVFGMDVVTVAQHNVTDVTNHIEMVGSTVGGWQFNDSSGLNITACDNGAGVVDCTGAGWRRSFIFVIGYDSGTQVSELHALYPSLTRTYTSAANCLDTVTNPLTYTLPTQYTGAAVMLYAYCTQRTATAWDTTKLIDLRTVKTGSATGGIDTTIFVPYSGATQDVNINGFTMYANLFNGTMSWTNITSAPWLTSETDPRWTGNASRLDGAENNITNLNTTLGVAIGNITGSQGAITNDRINISNFNATIGALIANDSTNRVGISNLNSTLGVAIANISNLNTTLAIAMANQTAMNATINNLANNVSNTIYNTSTYLANMSALTASVVALSNNVSENTYNTSTYLTNMSALTAMAAALNVNDTAIRSAAGGFTNTTANTSTTRNASFAAGIMLNTGDPQPACAAAYRGTLWMNLSGAGVTDFLMACMKNSSNSYNWVMVARGD